MTRKASKGGPRSGHGRTAEDDTAEAARASGAQGDGDTSAGEDARGGPDMEDTGSVRSDGGSAGKDDEDTGAGDDAPAEPAAGDEGSNPEGKPERADEITRLEGEIAQWKDKALRARADYQNLERRVREEAAIERDRVKARVLEGFLQVYEYSQMAAFEAERNPGPLADGVRMVVREFDRLLDHEGVRPIGEVGGPFDPRCHEAVAQEPAEGVGPGRVSRVVAQGYRLGDRVLRFAKVAVAPEEQDP